MKIFQLIDLIIRLFKLNKRSKVVLLFLIPTFLLGQNNGAFWLGKRTTGAPTNLLLDDYPGAAAAYSVRKLDKDYTGFAMEIRRAGDNATQNIGFVGEDLDVSAINAFCSGTACYIRTWYDQSGNSNNATQLSTANQPVIYTSGAIYSVNSSPAIGFDGGNDFLNTPNLANNSANTTFHVMKRRASGTHAIGFATTTSANPYTAYIFTDNNIYFNPYRAGFATTTFNNNNQNLITTLDPYAGNFLIYSNGSNIADNITAGTTASLTYFNSIARRVSDYGALDIQELIYYTSNKSTDRVSIENNINSYYSIY